MKFLCPIDYSELLKFKGDWLREINYKKNSQLYESISFSNIGEAYFTEMTAQNYEYVEFIEKKLKIAAISNLVTMDRKAKIIYATIELGRSKEARDIIEKELDEIKNNVYSKNKTHISMNSSFCIVLGPGCLVEQIISLHDEVKYKIMGLDSKLSNSRIIKDLRNTFDFNFTSIERTCENTCDAIIYFTTKEQAELSLPKLRTQPLKGLYGPICDMTHITNSSDKGTKVKVIIPIKISQEEVNKTFGCCQDLISLKSQNVREKTEIILKFKNYESTEFFAHNFRVLIRDRFEISFSSVQILSDGIFIPRHLHKYKREVKKYISNLRKESKCNIQLNAKCTRIYCFFSKLPDAAKDGIALLVKNEFLKIQPLI